MYSSRVSTISKLVRCVGKVNAIRVDVKNEIWRVISPYLLWDDQFLYVRQWHASRWITETLVRFLLLILRHRESCVVIICPSSKKLIRTLETLIITVRRLYVLVTSTLKLKLALPRNCKKKKKNSKDHNFWYNRLSCIRQELPQIMMIRFIYSP